MSFINPEKVPVTVYKWDDEDAPRLDRSPNCVATIFKACLVTGYGNKQGAGWTMPYEDTNAGVKVLRPAISPEQDFYLRLSADDGKQMTTQVYLNMTDINTGELKLQCHTPFKYGFGKISGKWLLIASDRGFWFFNEQQYSSTPMDKSGSYLFCGDTAKNMKGKRALWLIHTGGGYSDGDYDGDILSAKNQSNRSTIGQLFDGEKVFNAFAESVFNARTKRTHERVLAECAIILNNTLYPVLSVYTSSAGASDNNFTEFEALMSGKISKFISFSMTGNTISNFHIRCDEWEY